MKLRKKLGVLLVSTVLVLQITGCESSGEADRSAENTAPQNTASSNTETTADANRILIAYFTAAENSDVDAVSSASVVTVDGEAKGRLRAVADMIQAETNGTLFSIQTSVKYPGDGGALIDYAAKEQDEEARPELTSHIENLEDYNVIFVGYPTWWYDMPMILYSFFDEYDFSGKTIIPFNVHNGSRFSGTIETIQEMEPDAEVITDGFTVNERDVAEAAGDVAEWLRGLGILSGEGEEAFMSEQAGFGQIPDELAQIPKEYFSPASEQGTIERLDYQTYESKSYEEQTTQLDKTAYVYLPYGYSEERQYNVLYLMHGGWSNETTYLGTPENPHELKNVIDHAIQDGRIPPVIVVCPTYNNTSPEDSADYGLALRLTDQYHNELVNDLIPAAEGKYSTYAGGTSEQELKESRIHRAFAGFSMGSVTTWHTFQYCLDYFRYFLPSSGNLAYRVQEGNVHDGNAAMQYIYNGLLWLWAEE